MSCDEESELLEAQSFGQGLSMDIFVACISNIQYTWMLPPCEILRVLNIWYCVSSNYTIYTADECNFMMLRVAGWF